MAEVDEINSVDISACCKTCFMPEDVLIECDAITPSGVSLIQMMVSIAPDILTGTG